MNEAYAPTEIELEIMYRTSLLSEITKIRDEFDHLLHLEKYYDREITPRAIELLKERLTQAIRNFD